MMKEKLFKEKFFRTAKKKISLELFKEILFFGIRTEV